MVQVANSISRSYDPIDSPPLDELNQALKSKIAGFCNTSLDRLWRNPNPAFAWKWTTTSGLLTLNADGSLPWSAIQNSDDWFSLWSQDPRPMDSPPPNIGWWLGNSAYPVRCVEDAAFIWPRISQTTVYAFWRLPVPKLTSRLVNPATTYNTIGTLVWDESGTGNVFMSIAAGALGSNLGDTSKWTPQTIPYRLSNVLAQMAQSMMLEADGSDGSAALNDKTVDNWLDCEMAKENPRDGSGCPWSFDRRYQHFCRGLALLP
jgi:hypothetical protein